MDEKKVIGKGNKVSLSYEGSLDDGSIFDSSKHGDHEHPLEFEVGVGMVIPGFEEAAIGMAQGEEKKFTLTPQEAYGEYDPKLERDVPRKEIEFSGEPQVGKVLVATAPDGQQIPLKILKVTKDAVTVDLNHPLAGKNLHFKIKVIKIE